MDDEIGRRHRDRDSLTNAPPIRQGVCVTMVLAGNLGSVFWRQERLGKICTLRLGPSPMLSV